MAATDSSSDRDLPPLPPGMDPTSRGPSTQSLFSLTNGSSQPSEYRGSLGRDRSSRGESRRSIHSEIELRFGQIHNSWQAEKRRAEIAERRAEVAERNLQGLTDHLKAVNDARLVALRDAGRANEELKLYRLQLDHAQQEIYRAQDIIGMVDRQRHSAEQEAANSRNKTRQLQKTVLIQLARDEAYRKGLEEGLARGRELGTGTFGDRGGGEEGEGQSMFQGHYSDSETESRSPSPEYDHHAYPKKPRSIAPSEHSRAPARSRASPLPVHPPLPVNPSNAPTSRSRAPSLHPSENSKPLSIRASSVHPSEHKSIHNPPSVQPSPSIRPISIRNVAHTPHMNNTVPPPDNLIPSLDADNRIRLPPPFEFHRTPERPTTELPQTALSDASQEALPTRPRSNSNSTAQRQRQSSHHARNSSSGSNSSTLSVLDIVNNNPFNAAPRTPMSIIPEVNSAYSGSPQSQATGDHRDHTMYHQRSVSDHSAQRYQALPSTVPADRQSQYTARPRSRSSYAGSWADQQQQLDSRLSNDTINIDIQPPSISQKSQKTDSLWGGASGGGGSPSMSLREPLPIIHESPQQGYYAPSTFSRMPGGYINADHASSTGPPVIPKSSGYERQSRRHSRRNDDDDAVSSSMSADTLTTPPAQQQTMGQDWSGTLKGLQHPPLVPTSSARPAGSSSTAFWELPDSEVGTSSASVKSKKKGSKGSTR